MSLRYITPILSLSMSSFLCGTEHAENLFGSPVVSDNASFGSALAAAGKSGSFRMQPEELSRQASGVLAEEPTTPLGMRDPNKPPLRAGTPSEKPQSVLGQLGTFLRKHIVTANEKPQSVLEQLDAFLRNQIVTAKQSGKFDNLTEKQRLGLQYRNQIIVNTIRSMVLDDPAHATLHISVCESIADTMAQSIKQKLTSTPGIWDCFPSTLKQSIIESSVFVYTKNNGLVRILSDTISFEILASCSELADMLNSMKKSSARCGRFAADDDVPIDPEAHLLMLKQMAEKKELTPRGMHRCDSF